MTRNLAIGPEDASLLMFFVAVVGRWLSSSFFIAFVFLSPLVLLLVRLSYHRHCGGPLYSTFVDCYERDMWPGYCPPPPICFLLPTAEYVFALVVIGRGMLIVVLKTGCRSQFSSLLLAPGRSRLGCDLLMTTAAVVVTWSFSPFCYLSQRFPRSSVCACLTCATLHCALCIVTCL